MNKRKKRPDPSKASQRQAQAKAQAAAKKRQEEDFARQLAALFQAEQGREPPVSRPASDSEAGWLSAAPSAAEGLSASGQDPVPGREAAAQAAPGAGREAAMPVRPARPLLQEDSPVDAKLLRQAIADSLRQSGLEPAEQKASPEPAARKEEPEQERTGETSPAAPEEETGEPVQAAASQHCSLLERLPFLRRRSGADRDESRNPAAEDESFAPESHSLTPDFHDAPEEAAQTQPAQTPWEQDASWSDARLFQALDHALADDAYSEALSDLYRSSKAEAPAAGPEEMAAWLSYEPETPQTEALTASAPEAPKSEERPAAASEGQRSEDTPAAASERQRSEDTPAPMLEALQLTKEINPAPAAPKGAQRPASAPEPETVEYFTVPLLPELECRPAAAEAPRVPELPSQAAEAPRAPEQPVPAHTAEASVQEARAAAAEDQAESIPAPQPAEAFSEEADAVPGSADPAQAAPVSNWRKDSLPTLGELFGQGLKTEEPAPKAFKPEASAPAAPDKAEAEPARNTAAEKPMDAQSALSALSGRMKQGWTKLSASLRRVRARAADAIEDDLSAPEAEPEQSLKISFEPEQAAKIPSEPEQIQPASAASDLQTLSDKPASGAEPNLPQQPLSQPEAATAAEPSASAEAEDQAAEAPAEADNLGALPAEDSETAEELFPKQAQKPLWRRWLSELLHPQFEELEDPDELYEELDAAFPEAQSPLPVEEERSLPPQRLDGAQEDPEPAPVDAEPAPAEAEAAAEPLASEAPAADPFLLEGLQLQQEGEQLSWAGMLYEAPRAADPAAAAQAPAGPPEPIHPEAAPTASVRPKTPDESSLPEPAPALRQTPVETEAPGAVPAEAETSAEPEELPELLPVFRAQSAHHPGSTSLDLETLLASAVPMEDAEPPKSGSLRRTGRAEQNAHRDNEILARAEPPVRGQTARQQSSDPQQPSAAFTEDSLSVPAEEEPQHSGGLGALRGLRKRRGPRIRSHAQPAESPADEPAPKPGAAAASHPASAAASHPAAGASRSASAPATRPAVSAAAASRTAAASAAAEPVPSAAVNRRPEPEKTSHRPEPEPVFPAQQPEPELFPEDAYRRNAKELSGVGTGLILTGLFTILSLFFTLYLSMRWSFLPELFSGGTTVYLLLLLLAAILISDLGSIRRALRGIREKQFSPVLLILTAAFFTALDTFSAARAVRPTFTVVVGALLMVELWGRYDRGMALAATLKVLREPDLAAGVSEVMDTVSGSRCLKRTVPDVERFMQKLEKHSFLDRVMSVYTPVMLAAGLVITGLVGFGLHRDPIWTGSLVFLGSVPMAGLLAFPRLFLLMANKLSDYHAAICGYHGAEAFGGEHAILIGDEDIFPAGSLALNGFKVYNGSPDRLIAYAAAAAKRSGSALAPLFDDLLLAHNGRHYTVDTFRFYDSGGIGATIIGDVVLMGSLEFMRRMGVHMDKGTKVRQAVYMSLNGELAAVFAVKYEPPEHLRRGLASIAGNRHFKGILVTRTFLGTPGFLKAKFGIPTGSFAYPDTRRRLRLSQAEMKRSGAQGAILAKDSFTGFAQAAAGGRVLRSATALAAVLAVLSGVAGLLLMGVLASLPAYETATAVNLLFYVLAWLAPTLLLTAWARHI